MYIDRIKTDNIKCEIRDRIMPYVYRLSSLPFVEGVVLLGGLSNTSSRDFMDKFSDVDMSIFIEGTHENFDKWNELPDFEFHIPFQNRLLEINVHQQFVDDERKSEWDEAKKEAYTYTCEIVCDKKHTVRNLILEKTEFDEDYRKKRLSIILSQYLWLVNINPFRQIERGYILNAMDLLNVGVDLFIEGLYLYNRRYRPHPKWRFEIACDLKWVPDNFESLMKNSFLVESISMDTIMKRRAALSNLFFQLQEKVLEENLFANYSAYEYACRFAYVDRQMSAIDNLQKLFQPSLLKELNLTDDGYTLLHGLLNEYMVKSIDELLQLENANLPIEYGSLIEKIRGKLE